VPDFTQLTERQREIYDFIREKIESRGFGPTVREIGEAFEIKSPNGVMCHLKALEKKALIKRTGFRARAIQLIDHRPPGSTTLPLVGHVAAGSPIEAIAQEDRLDFKDLFGSPDYYALKVHGQSMIEDHIDDGDYVVIDRKGAGRATNGDRVVARIHDEVTLKRFFRERHRVRLEPANKAMAPIYVGGHEDVEVLGTLVGVIRRC
jgi:repressor LexA